MKSASDIEGKKFLTIGEVAEKFGISVECLRKWEGDFPRFLRPMRTKRDTRLYGPKHIEQVAVIYRLLRVEGLSIDGAKKKLSTKQSDEEIRQEVIFRLQGVRDKLMEVVNEIEGIRS